MIEMKKKKKKKGRRVPFVLVSYRHWGPTRSSLVYSHCTSFEWDGLDAVSIPWRTSSLFFFFGWREHSSHREMEDCTNAARLISRRETRRQYYGKERRRLVKAVVTSTWHAVGVFLSLGPWIYKTAFLSATCRWAVVKDRGTENKEKTRFGLFAKCLRACASLRTSSLAEKRSLACTAWRTGLTTAPDALFAHPTSGHTS